MFIIVANADMVVSPGNDILTDCCPAPTKDFCAPPPIVCAPERQYLATLVQQYLTLIMHVVIVDVYLILDDQTQVDSKPAGQPEQASLNQCQLIAP